MVLRRLRMPMSCFYIKTTHLRRCTRAVAVVGCHRSAYSQTCALPLPDGHRSRGTATRCTRPRPPASARKVFSQLRRSFLGPGDFCLAEKSSSRHRSLLRTARRVMRTLKDCAGPRETDTGLGVPRSCHRMQLTMLIGRTINFGRFSAAGCVISHRAQETSNYATNFWSTSRTLCHLGWDSRDPLRRGVADLFVSPVVRWEVPAVEAGA